MCRSFMARALPPRQAMARVTPPTTARANGFGHVAHGRWPSPYRSGTSPCRANPSWLSPDAPTADLCYAGRRLRKAARATVVYDPRDRRSNCRWPGSASRSLPPVLPR